MLIDLRIIDTTPGAAGGLPFTPPGGFTGDAEAYRYLVESIRKFPSQSDFAEMIRRAGFSRVTWTNYSGGIAALHSGWKL